MWNKQSLSFEKCIHFIFHYFKFLFTFSSLLLFRGLVYSVLARSIMCLIDKSSQFCNTENKYEVAITCAFGHRLRLSIICNVPTCTAVMHMLAKLRKYRVLRYLISFLEEIAANSVYLSALFSHVKQHISTRGIPSLLVPYKGVPTDPF